MIEKKYKIGIIGGGAVGLTYASLMAEKAAVVIKTFLPFGKNIKILE